MSEAFGTSPSSARGILAVNAASALGSAVCVEFAAKGSRILIHHTGALDEACRIAARAAERQAAALPLEMDLSSDTDACARLVERMVEDFGRLDVVVYLLEDSSDESLAQAEACLQAATPALRASRPAGHFVLVGRRPTDDAEACRALEKRFEEFANGSGDTRGRKPRVNTLLAAPDCSPEKVARCVVGQVG